MANLEVKKPSDEAVAKAAADFVIQDANGRSITLKKPGVLAQYRLIEALGDSAKNEVYMAMVLPLIYVVKIDDNDVRSPNTKREVEALIQQLDEVGIEAVVSNVQEKFGKSDPEGDKAALKN